MEQFDCTDNWVDGVSVVGPVGEIDIQTAPDLDKALTAHLDDDPVAVVVRLDLVTFLDSRGIAVLVKAWKNATEHDIAFSLAAPSAPVRKIFDVTGLARAVPIHATLRTALAEAAAIVRGRSQPPLAASGT